MSNELLEPDKATCQWLDGEGRARATGWVTAEISTAALETTGRPPNCCTHCSSDSNFRSMIRKEKKVRKSHE